MEPEKRQHQLVTAERLHLLRMLGGGRVVRIARWVVAVLLAATVSMLLIARIRTANQTLVAHSSPSAIGVHAGQAAPDFTLTPMSPASGPLAQTIHLDDLRGHVVVVNFWSPACAPCHDEASTLESSARQYHTRGVVFVGVTLESSREDMLAFIQHYAISYACGLDTSHTIAVAYGLVAIPVTVVIGKHREVLRVIQGAVARAALDQALLSALTKPR